MKAELQRSKNRLLELESQLSTEKKSAVSARAGKEESDKLLAQSKEEKAAMERKIIQQVLKT